MRLSKAYAEGVVGGDIPGGHFVKKACQRYLYDLTRQDLIFDEAKADLVCRFIELLPHTEGVSGRVALMPWQRFIIDNLYGFWFKDGQGVLKRRFTTSFVMVPRKNGKSLLAAGVALYHLLADGEQGAKVLCAATKREQANLVFDVARQMAKRTPEIKKFVKVLAYEVRVENTGSMMRSVTAEADTAHGWNPSCVIADETHQWIERPSKTNMWSVLKNGQVARDNPMLFSITTAGNDKQSKGYELCQYTGQLLADAKKCVDDRFFSYVSQADKEDQWDDVNSAIKANPLMQEQLGFPAFLQFEKLQDEINTAKGIISDQVEYRRYHLNVWDFAGEQKWIDNAKWDALAVGSKPDLKGKQCYVGVDLSSIRDITAISFLFPNVPEKGQLYVLPYFFLPSATVAEKKEGVAYHNYIHNGDLFLITGQTVDYGELFGRFQKLAKEFRILRVGVDPWQASQFTKLCVEAKYAVEEITSTLPNLSEPRKMFEKLIIDGKIRHNNSPMMSWMVGNVCLEVTHDDRYKLHRPEPQQKIDGVDASINALALWLQDELTKKATPKFCPYPLLHPKRAEWVREHEQFVEA